MGFKLSSIAAMALAGVLLAGCATVPKEIVTLSYRMGEDIATIHSSYNKLIHIHFEALQQERLRYVDEEWTPKYLKDWIATGRLREVVRGEVVWSVERLDFVKPLPGKAEEGIQSTVAFWSQAAVQEIESKKQELLKPLQDQERQLATWVEDAFNRLYRANAAITSQLNSLRKVQEIQDESLAALNLKDLRDKINNALEGASQKARTSLDEVRRVDGILQETKTKLKKPNVP